MKKTNRIKIQTCTRFVKRIAKESILRKYKNSYTMGIFIYIYIITGRFLILKQRNIVLPRNFKAQFQQHQFLVVNTLARTSCKPQTRALLTTNNIMRRNNQTRNSHTLLTNNNGKEKEQSNTNQSHDYIKTNNCIYRNIFNCMRAVSDRLLTIKRES